ncbi:MAG: hypothetical protein RIG82_12050 [Phycisphaeraceae bacterium]
MDLSAAHLHVALVHLPMIGVGAAAIPLIVGLILKNRACTDTGLWMLVVFGWSIAAVMSTGETAKELAEQGLGIAPYLDEAAWGIMDRHYDEAEVYAKLVYLTAALASIAIVLRWFKKVAWQKPVAWLAAVAAVVSVPGMVYVAMSGGQIRHPEFRPDRPVLTEPVAVPEGVGDVDEEGYDRD